MTTGEEAASGEPEVRPATGPDPESATPWSGGSRRLHVLQLVAVFAGALVTRLLTVGHFVTHDEVFWMRRTARFSDALLDGRFGDASGSHGELATLPGVPTMWLGSFARLVWALGGQLGLIDEGQDFPRSLSGLWTAQVMVALATAGLVVLIVALVHRWAGWGAAAVVAVLLVGEPWLTAHGSLLHTDELTALFGTAGLLLLALAFDVPDRFDCRRPVLMAALGGLVLVQAPLTKVLGLPFAFGAAAIVVVALRRDLGGSGRGEESDVRRLRRRQVAAAVGAAVLAIPLEWPAVLFDPSTQIPALIESSQQAGAAHQTVFLGEATGDPGPLFYPVVLALRVTPWFLLALLVAVPVALSNRTSRSRAGWVIVWTLPLAFVLLMAEKQLDRYGLILLVPLTVLVGVAFGPYVVRLLGRKPVLRPVGAGVFVAVVLAGALVAPWGLLYYSPLFGGSDAAEELSLVGWGEGWEAAVEEVRELQGGDCDDVTIDGVGSAELGVPSIPVELAWFEVPCSRVRAGEPTYRIVYVNQRQRLPDEVLEEALEGREKVASVEIRGIVVATVWR